LAEGVNVEGGKVVHGSVKDVGVVVVEFFLVQNWNRGQQNVGGGLAERANSGGSTEMLLAFILMLFYGRSWVFK